MSNIIPSTDTNTLTQRLQSAEKSIIFIQREHASTLANLHEEIAKWQQKYSDLTFQLSIGGTVINSSNDGKLQATIEQLENKLQQYKDKIEKLNKILEEKEKLENDYENRLIVNDRKHALELHTQYNKQRELKIELEKRSTLIAQLTHQIHQEKQHQQSVYNRIRLEQIMLPNKSTKCKNNDEQRHLLSGRRLSSRSSSLNHRTIPDQESKKILFIGRSTPSQHMQSFSSKNFESDDVQLCTKYQRPLLNNHIENVNFNKITSSQSKIKLSTVLPPIINRKMPLKALTMTTFQREDEA